MCTHQLRRPGKQPSQLFQILHSFKFNHPVSSLPLNHNTYCSHPCLTTHISHGFHRPSPIIFLLPTCCFIPFPKSSKHSLLTQESLCQRSIWATCRYYLSSDPLDPVNQSHSQCYSRSSGMTSVHCFFQFQGEEMNISLLIHMFSLHHMSPFRPLHCPCFCQLPIPRDLIYLENQAGTTIRSKDKLIPGGTQTSPPQKIYIRNRNQG